MTTPTASPDLTNLTYDQLLERARAAVGEIAPALRHLSADQIVDRIRHHTGRLLADGRTAATEVTATAERLVAERLTARIKAKVAPPIQAAITVAVLALLFAAIALYRTRGRS